MTVSVQDPINKSTGNGVATVYPYQFKILDDEDLVVTVDGVLQTLNSNYTVSGVGVEAGGNVTFTSAPANGALVVIYRDTELKRETAYQQSGDFLAGTVNPDFDGPWLALQDLKRDIQRAIRLPIAADVDSDDLELSPLENWKSKYLAFDADGAPTPAALSAETMTQTIIGSLLYPRTAAEQAAGVVPVNYAVPSHDNTGAIYPGRYHSVGATDHTNALQACVLVALQCGDTIKDDGDYTISATVDFRRCPVDFGRATVTVAASHAGIGLHVGGYSSSESNPTQRFYKITREGGDNGTAYVRVIGAKGQEIHIQHCDRIEFWASTDSAYGGDSGNAYSIGYSKFYLGTVKWLTLTNDSGTDGSDTQWINENDFYLSRMRTELVVEGTYDHNHNRFWGGAFENVVITFTRGSSNTMHGPRFETSAAITFASGTWGNRVIPTWESNPRIVYDDDNQTGVSGVVTITDSGSGNIVQPLAAMMFRSNTIIDISSETCKSFTAASTNYTTLAGVNLQCYGPDKFSSANSQTVFATDLIPVVIGDAVEIRSDVSMWRFRFELYDSNRVRMSESTHASIADWVRGYSGLAWSDANDRYENSSNQSRQIAIVENTAIAYLKLIVVSGPAVSGTPFRTLSATLRTQTRRSSTRAAANHQRPVNAAVSSSPTRGFGRLGEKVSNTAGGWFTQTFALDTTTSASSAIGGSTVTVTTVTGITSGDIIGVVQDDGSTHWTTVNGAPAGSVVTLSAVLTSAVASGNRVVVARWTAT